MYYFQTIQPHHAGFNQWQQSHELNNGWAMDSDLIQEIADNLSGVELFELGKDELPEGLEDIRGNILGGTPRETILSESIFGYLGEDAQPVYFAIVETAEEYREE